VKEVQIGMVPSESSCNYGGTAAGGVGQIEIRTGDDPMQSVLKHTPNQDEAYVARRRQLFSYTAQLINQGDGLAAGHDSSAWHIFILLRCLSVRFSRLTATVLDT